ncbi:hypothetical protein CIY_28900 [Butyrivibrio fibrisolvens 16/4]|nr:hypothetical protein CIY_28900 [Butyrivibrio fibrisolvens 16/4]
MNQDLVEIVVVEIDFSKIGVRKMEYFEV